MFVQVHIKKIITSILVGALFVFSQSVFSQQDTIKPIKDEGPVLITSLEEAPADTLLIIKEREHYPKVAIISSAIVPGLGQAYNKKYWKIPLIYGGGAIIYYFYDYNNDYYQRLKVAYNQVKSGEDVSDPDLQGMDATTLEYRRDYFRRNRDYNVIFIGLLYVANVVDALVDAHMYKYDISRDLTMQIGPTIIPPDPATYMATCGVKVKFSF